MPFSDSRKICIFRLLSIRLACCPPHSGTEGQIVQVPNYPWQKLDDQMIRFSFLGFRSWNIQRTPEFTSPQRRSFRNSVGK